MKPVRIQLRRKAGFNLQGFSQNLNGLPAVHVARPGKWGNLFRVGMAGIPDAATAVEFYRRAMTGDYDQTALLKAGFPSFVKPDLSALRGKNLACWCKLGTPCHADVLLELANA